MVHGEEDLAIRPMDPGVLNVPQTPVTLHRLELVRCEVQHVVLVLADRDPEVEGGPLALAVAGQEDLVLLRGQDDLVVPVPQLLHLQVEPREGPLVAEGDPLVGREDQDVLAAWGGGSVG